jgi:hypothetical protein
MSAKFKNWTGENNINLIFIRPETPSENVYIESFNKRLME